MIAFEPMPDYYDTPEPRVLIANFEIPGEPVSKARARITRYGHAYTPDKTVKAEVHVAAAFRQAAPSHIVDEVSAFEVVATFINGTRQRRDVDNMLKLIMDGLNGVAWKDDNQVVQVNGRKILARERSDAHTRVSIYSVGRTAAARSACLHCGKEFITYPSIPPRYCSSECYISAGRARRTTSCELCGAEFERHGSKTRRFCSQSCRSSACRVTVTCATCGIAYSLPTSVAARGHKHFHSPQCQQAAYRPVRAEAARGVCGDCSGPTSKKAYARCARCSSIHRQKASA